MNDEMMMAVFMKYSFEDGLALIRGYEGAPTMAIREERVWLQHLWAEAGIYE